MPKFTLRLEAKVTAFVAVTIEADNEHTARLYGEDAVHCLNNDEDLLAVVSKAMPREDSWVIDRESASDWELEDVDEVAG